MINQWLCRLYDSVDCCLTNNCINYAYGIFQDFMVSIFIREKWSDHRLRFGNLSNDEMITLDARLAEQLWLPDLYFTNEKEAHFHYVTVPNRYVRIFRNGTVYHSARFEISLCITSF